MHSTFISQTSWMRDIPHETPVTALSIPGTHKSVCIGGPLGFGQTQNLDLSHQLIAGIRFFDLRLAHYQDNLFAHHDVVHMEKCYAEVLNTCSNFLHQSPLTYWPENQTFRSAATPVYDVHDRYRGLKEEEKCELVVAHLEEAKKGDLKDLYITFSSTVGLKAHGYADDINPRLSDYLVESSKGRVGIVAMDYFEEPPELVSNVIKMN